MLQSLPDTGRRPPDKREGDIVTNAGVPEPSPAMP